MSLFRLGLAAVVGFVVGSLAMMACHLATQGLYPPPEGLDVMDPGQREAVMAWMETLPDGAFVVAMLCHAVGAAVGAAVGMLIGGRANLRPAVVVGILFTVAGVINVMSVPHPSWFPFVDVPVYLLVALLVGWWMRRTPEAPSAGSASHD